MAEAQLQIFLEKVRQLNAFVALSEADPHLRRALIACEHHDQVVALARRCGFEIGRRWGEPSAAAESGADLQLLQAPSHNQAAGTQAAMRQDGPASVPPLSGPGGSLLNSPCPAPGEERIDVLLQTPHWRLERIHSCAAVSPEGFWYDQSDHEWLTLVQGSARLRFEAEEGDRELASGDSLLIEAGKRHRVSATDGAPGTIWLALFWSPI